MNTVMVIDEPAACRDQKGPADKPRINQKVLVSGCEVNISKPLILPQPGGAQDS